MDRITEYFVNEKGTTEVVAKVLRKSLVKYPDIETEFCYWLDNRSFDIPNALEIEGYTAKQISEIAPFIDASGVYQFMVTLRDNPKKAHDYIKNGFPTK